MIQIIVASFVRVLMRGKKNGGSNKATERTEDCYSWLFIILI